MSRTDGGAQPAVASVEEDPNAAVVCSSPPCFMHELDPSYLGYLGREEVAALVRALLAAEWGGDATAEARLRAALRRHLAGAPDPGTPRASAEAQEDRGLPDRLARMARDALPRIHDDALRRDIEGVLGLLERDAPRRDSLQTGS